MEREPSIVTGSSRRGRGDKWVWSQRNCLYLLGALLLLLATLGYAVGDIAPFWVRQDGVASSNIPDVDFGIWFRIDDGDLASYDFHADADYLKATRILQLLGLVGLVLSLGLLLFVNCRWEHRGRSVVVEAVAFVSALVGLGGSMTYLGFTRDDVDTLTNLSYNWAFYLNVAATGLALLAALLLFASNMTRNSRLHPSSAKDRGSPASWMDPDYVRERADGSPYHEDPRELAGPYNDVPYSMPYTVFHPDDQRAAFFQGYPPRDYDDGFHRGGAASQKRDRVNDGQALSQRLVHSKAEPKSESRDVTVSSRSWQEGLEELMLRSPAQQRRLDQRRHMLISSPQTARRNQHSPPYPASPQMTARYQHSPPYPSSPQTIARYQQPQLYPPSAQVMEMPQWMIPRVVLRGYYEPGYGYPEYVLM